MKKYALAALVLFLLVGSFWPQEDYDELFADFQPNYTQVQPEPVIPDASMIDRDDLHGFVNAHRVDKGREKLVLNQRLNKSAMAKCKHMAKHKYWDHYGDNGETPWQWLEKAGINYNRAGENLAHGQYSAYEVFTDWKASKGHNRNLLERDFAFVGYAVCNATDYNGLEKAVITVQHLADVIQ